MLRTEKNEFVEAMKADLAKAESVLFLDFTGLTVAEADAFRCKLREAQITYRVVKNTLMKRAILGTGYEDAAKWLKGSPTGVVLGFEDPVSPARTTYEFLKECKNLKVKGGVLDNKAIGENEAEALSKMPSREEMQAQIVAQALAPARNLLAQIKHPAGRIVGALDALEKKSEGAEEDAA